MDQFIDSQKFKNNNLNLVILLEYIMIFILKIRLCQVWHNVTSQIPVKLWHETIGNETLADAILDRLVHNSYRIELKGGYMRKVRSKMEKPEKLAF